MTSRRLGLTGLILIIASSTWGQDPVKVFNFPEGPERSVPILAGTPLPTWDPLLKPLIGDGRLWTHRFGTGEARWSQVNRDNYNFEGSRVVRFSGRVTNYYPVISFEAKDFPEVSVPYPAQGLELMVRNFGPDIELSLVFSEEGRTDLVIPFDPIYHQASDTQGWVPFRSSTYWNPFTERFDGQVPRKVQLKAVKVSSHETGVQFRRWAAEIWGNLSEGTRHELVESTAKDPPWVQFQAFDFEMAALWWW